MRRQGGRRPADTSVGVGRILAGIAMYSRKLCAATVMAASLMAGCHQLKSDFTDWRLSRQINGYAADAWDEYEDAYEAEIYYMDDFGDGFRAGYAQILAGGDVCPPTLPPTRYWKARYQTQDGRDRIDTWFAGHEAGVATAMQDGIGGIHKIPLSPFRRAQLAGSRSCPTCFPPAETAPTYDYEAVPPTPPGEVTQQQYQEMPAEFSDAAALVPAEVEVETDVEQVPVAPVNFGFADDAAVQE